MKSSQAYSSYILIKFPVLLNGCCHNLKREIWKLFNFENKQTEQRFENDTKFLAIGNNCVNVSKFT